MFSRSFLPFLCSCLALAPAATISSATSSAASSACTGNTADDRSVWCDYSIDTNYYDYGPDTEAIVEYWWELTNVTASPDGVARDVLAVNGSVPGPQIEANWGDTVVIHVTNNLTMNGTGIHFHGIRQNWTNPMDGVPSITQCPTIPGDTITYRWKATQYGSSWYHSHYALQAWEGVFGGIVIHGPATANYDEDLGSLFLNDWDHQTVDALYTSAQTSGPPTLDNGLINGTNIWNNGSVGSRFETSFESGKSYLLRLVNGAVDTHFDFSIDNHTLQIIANDFVPINPYYRETISIGMGQRYDVIVHANMSDVASDFWLRATPDSFCSDNGNADDIRGMIHYDGSDETPSTKAWDIAEGVCNGEPMENTVPYLALDAEVGDLQNNLNVSVGKNDANLFKWYVGSRSFVMDWGNPTALQVLNGDTSFGNASGVIELPTANQWTVLMIEAEDSVPHPIHLHGHDFYVLAQGYGSYSSSNTTFQTSNPPRRDVAMLPASGYLAIGFKADNPGVWLCHCHIGWHTEEGFALQFVERYDEIAGLYGNVTAMEDSCDTWNDWQGSVGLVQDDSGV